MKLKRLSDTVIIEDRADGLLSSAMLILLFSNPLCGFFFPYTEEKEREIEKKHK